MKQDIDGLAEDTTWLEWFTINFHPTEEIGRNHGKQDVDYFKCKILCGICDALEDIVLELKRSNNVKNKKT